MTKHWVMLYEGPVWQAKILQAQLDGYGVPNYVPEPGTQTLNPQLAGVPLCNSCVMVPPECEEEARALLENSPDKLIEEETS